MPRRPSSSDRIPWFFTIFWALGTLTFDAVLAYTTLMNVRAMSYVETLGIITVSKVDRIDDSDGDSFRPHIEYDYFVGDDEYHGTRRRYGELGVGGSGADRSVRDIARRYRVGEQVPVFYNADRPAEAVLEYGIGGMDLFMALFLTPFNVVMLALCAGSARTEKTNLDADNPLAGMIRESARGWRVTLKRGGFLVAFFAVLAALAFVMIFVVGFGIGLPPSVTSMAVVWSIVLAGALASGVWTCASPPRITVDDLERTLRLAAFPGRKPFSVAADRITKLATRNRRRPTKSVPQQYEVVVEYSDEADDTQRKTVGTGLPHGQAVALEAWLREKLRLEPATAPERDADATNDHKL